MAESPSAASIRRVDWNGIQADYTEQDDLFMRTLRQAGASDQELQTIHALHGLLGAYSVS